MDPIKRYLYSLQLASEIGKIFIYLGSGVSSTETYVNTHLAKVWIAVDSLSIKWKSDLSDKMKRNLWLIQYYCTDAPHGRLQNALRKKIDENDARMLQVILDQFW